MDVLLVSFLIQFPICFLLSSEDYFDELLTSPSSNITDPEPTGSFGVGLCMLGMLTKVPRSIQEPLVV